jgi:hypothetical protein
MELDSYGWRLNVLQSRLRYVRWHLSLLGTWVTLVNRVQSHCTCWHWTCHTTQVTTLCTVSQVTVETSARSNIWTPLFLCAQVRYWLTTQTFPKLNSAN